MELDLSPEDIAFNEKRNQQKTVALKSLRVSINTVIAEAKNIRASDFMYGAGVDELDYALTYLKQARMWAGEALGELGHKLPEEYRDEAKQVKTREQFDPHKHPWPDGVIAWHDVGYQPRDMSWGFVQTSTGRVHVHTGDWIITNLLDNTKRVEKQAK